MTAAKTINRTSPFNPPYEINYSIVNISEIKKAIEDQRAYVNIQGHNYQVLSWEESTNFGTIKTRTMNLEALIIRPEQIQF